MTDLAILASGMVTALGFNAPSSLAALRAGISAVRDIPWADYESGRPLRGARVLLPQWWEGLGKLADLIAPAIRECLVAAEPEPPQAIPILPELQTLSVRDEPQVSKTPCLRRSSFGWNCLIIRSRPYFLTVRPAARTHWCTRANCWMPASFGCAWWLESIVYYIGTPSTRTSIGDG